MTPRKIRFVVLRSDVNDAGMVEDRLRGDRIVAFCDDREDAEMIAMVLNERFPLSGSTGENSQ